MKVRIAVVIVFFGLCCFGTKIKAGTEIVDRIVAVVNNEVITLSELRKVSALMYGDSAKNKSSTQRDQAQDLERKILEQLIEKKLIVQEAKKIDLKVTDSELNEALDLIVKQNNMNLAQFKEALQNEGSALEDYLEILKSEILQSQIIGREIRSRISITDKDIEKYYNKNIKPKEKPGAKVRIQQILLLVQADSTAEQIAAFTKQLQAIRAKILAGEDFEKLAIRYSQGPAAKQGGDLGYFVRGELLAPIEEAAFGLEKGEVSQVITTSVGLHLIKILDKQTGQGKQEWKAREDEIEEILYRQAFDQQYGKWLEELRKNAYIEINL